MTFVDLTKALDTVSRDGFLKIMAKLCCPTRCIAIVRQFHDGIQARFRNDREYSESVMFSAMLTDAFQDLFTYQVPLFYSI